MTSIRYHFVDNSITAMIRRLEDFGKENLPKESGVCEGQDGYQSHTSIALQVNKISIHTAHLTLSLPCLYATALVSCAAGRRCPLPVYAIGYPLGAYDGKGRRRWWRP